MLTPADLAEAQQLQLATLLDVCEIRWHDTTALVDGTETEVEGQVAVRLDGETRIPCRVAAAGGDIASFRMPSIGEQRVPTGTVIVTVPVGVVGVRPDRMLVKIIASNDPDMVGRRYPITDVDRSTYPTARRLVCLSPEEV